MDIDKLDKGNDLKEEIDNLSVRIKTLQGIKHPEISYLLGTGLAIVENNKKLILKPTDISLTEKYIDDLIDVLKMQKMQLEQELKDL